MAPLEPAARPPRRGLRLRRLLGRSCRLRSNIGLRLALLALAIGLPFVLYVGFNAARRAALERDESQQRALSVARLYAARVDNYVGEVIGALALVAHGASADPAARGANDAFLHRIRADLPRSVDDAAVWSPDGADIGSLDRANTRTDLPIAERAFFRSALRTGGSALEGPLVSRPNGEPTVVFARAMLSEGGRVTGVATVSAQLRDLQRLVDVDGTAPPGTVVAIVDAEGVVLARNFEPERWIGKNVLNAGKAREHNARGEGVDETLGADSVPRIAGYARAGRVPWHVFIGMPADAALSAPRASLAETIAVGSLSLLLGAAIAAWIGTRIAKPLRRLAYDATLLARGNLAHRTAVAGGDEARVLAHALNRLARTVGQRSRALREKSDALEEKTAALERSTVELATITANVPVLIAYVDAEERFHFVNEYLRDALGIAPKKVIGRTLRDLLGDDVYGRLEAQMREVRAGLPQTFEASFAPDGGAPVFIVSCFPDYGERQEVRGAYVVCQDITRRKDAEDALAARERFVRLIADGIPARITYIDVKGRVLFGNRRFAEYWGLDPQGVVGRRIDDIVSPAASAQIEPELARSCRGEARHYDLVVERADGAQYYQVDYVPDVDATGTVQGVVTISQDVTALRRAQEALAESRERLQRITDSIPSLVGYIDRDRRYRFNNRYYETWLGRPLSEITGRLVSDVLGPQAYAEIAANLDRAFDGERVDFDVEAKQAGGSRFVRGTYVPDFDASGRVIGVYTSSTDVTPLKEVERQLERLAQNDALTGLPNRHMYNDGIAAALRRSQRSGSQIALLFLDIDGFKTINDTLGHAAGDDVLREFARRLLASVRTTDLVARLAGDEFVIVLEGIHTRDECRFVARKILAAMRRDFRVGASMVKVTTSIGIALGQGGETTPEALLTRADSALYAAKGHGRDTYEIAI